MGGQEQLVIDAVEAFAASVPEVPDTGSVDDDLRLWARSIVATVTTPDSGAIVRALSSAGDAPQVRDLQRRYYRTRLSQVLPIVERAVQRGQLPTGTDATEVIKHVGAPLYYRLLVIAEPVTVDAADLAAAAAAHAYAHCDRAGRASHGRRYDWLGGPEDRIGVERGWRAAASVS